MGGVGKTELAWQYATRHRDQGDYPAGIWWLYVRDQDLLTQLLAKAARMQFTLPDHLKEPAELAQVCYDQWAARTQGSGLLVLDDVPQYDQVQNLLPQNPRLKVLMTSRVQFDRPVRCLPLEVLKPEQALNLLQQIVGVERLQHQITEASALCDWLGYLPLGIELVSRYLVAKPDLSLAEMQHRLTQQRLKARALTLPAELRGQARPYENLTAAFELRWQELSPEVQQLACGLSLFALAPIDWKLVQSCWPDVDPEDLEDWRDRLINLHLLERTQSQTYQLHQLLREFFAAKSSDCADIVRLQTAFAATLTDIARTIPQVVTLTDIARVQTAIPHLEAATNYVQYLPQQDFTQLWSFTGLARFYREQSRWQVAEQWYKVCLAHAEQLGAEHPNVSGSLNNLARLYESQGRYSEAEPLHLRALKISEQQLGADHIDVAISLSNLAGLYRVQGRYSEAEPLYLRALEIWKQQLGADHPDVATSLNGLAALYKSQGRYSEAEPLHLRALKIREQQLGAGHLDVATSLNDLAGLYHAQERYSEAEPLHLRALKIREQQLGADHPDVATSLNDLAGLYRTQGCYSEAEPLHLKALQISEQQLGAEHPAVAINLGNLGLLYVSLERYAEVEPLYLRALRIFRARLGDEHPYTQETIRRFIAFLHQLIATNRTAELSDDPLTQALLQKVRVDESD